MTLQNRGAEISAHIVKPSIDLATLISLVSKAVPVSADAEPETQDPKQRRAILFDDQKRRLRVCTSSVLRRLFGQREFRQFFDPAKGRGFVWELTNPAYGMRSRVGGNLSEGSADRLAKAVDELMAVIDQAIDSASPTSVPLSSLLLEQPEQQFQNLAKRVGASYKTQAHSANLIPLAFMAEDKVTPKDKPVAKVISAIERIDAADYFERMCSAVGDYLAIHRDYDEDDIESAIDSLKDEQIRIDSQITRFLNFLDDEALARVRLAIAFQIMETIADQAQAVRKPGHQALVEYVHRASCLFETAHEVGYTVDLSAHYGTVAEFELSEYLNKATFYSCLPVWAEWKTQIFEEKTRNQESTSYSVVREVSYRFRVNGQKPETGKAAFSSRLDDIEEELNDWEALSKSQPGRLCRRLAELLFLAVVTPNAGTQEDQDVSSLVQQRLAQLKSGGKEAVQNLLQELRQQSSTMDQIATALVEVLRTKSQRIISQVQRRSSQQFICVKRTIVEWSRLEGAEPGVKDLLVSSPQRSREQVEWFRHIEVSKTPDVPGTLFSVSVSTEISEHNLVVRGEECSLQAQRLLPSQLLQVCWVPYCSEKKEDSWVYKVVESASDAKDWILPASVHVEYDIKTLQKRERSTDDSKQFHAAAVAAFTIFTYCCLWRITQRLKGESAHDFTTLMLRLQETGKSREEGNGDDYVYAAAQSIEALLAQDIKIRMQGISLHNLNPERFASKYVKAGVFDALLSAFPIAISTPTVPSVPKVGLISYATRPCDEQPILPNNEKGHLLLAQSYLATVIEHPFVGYQLQAERMQVDIVDTPEQLGKQRLVQEEISYLKAQGCEHIILLSHAYGGRHLNRAADYNSLLTPKEFLAEISKTFSDLTIYTLLRDVFPATRLKRRDADQAAFEILRAGDHTTFLRDLNQLQVRNVIPVYTFATLNVVQEDKRPQSGFCVYFLVSDQRVGEVDWMERPRRHLVDADQRSEVHPCLLSLLRGLHFIEAERGEKKGQLIPVLDPFSWISPATVEAAGEVEIMHTRRRGKVLLSYPALLCHVSRVLHRRK
ncbi:hypothetical protein NDI52_29650 [Leptolyngbya sp. PL-A3]|uniref:hypothetical protein n=1 Tax=Leptolyngbya sp. PL-A3 TaxID=2933911 RepID=UPI0032976BC4